MKSSHPRKGCRPVLMDSWPQRGWPPPGPGPVGPAAPGPPLVWRAAALLRYLIKSARTAVQIMVLKPDDRGCERSGTCTQENPLSNENISRRNKGDFLSRTHRASVPSWEEGEKRVRERGGTEGRTDVQRKPAEPQLWAMVPASATGGPTTACP